VSLAAIKQNNEVTITVSDTGAGISPEHLLHILNGSIRFLAQPEPTTGMVWAWQ